MASTRNNNTLGNYRIEKKQNIEASQYATNNLYSHQPIKMAGYGFIQGHLPLNTMSNNSVDIESFLFGINSTNLTQPKDIWFTPELKTLHHESVVKDYNNPVILPAPLICRKNQRPVD